MSQITAVCNCSDRTIRDWQRERFSMDYVCMTKIAKAANITMPQVKKVDAFAHASRAGKKGAEAVMKKYGRVPVDEDTRKEKWKEWWGREGKNRNMSIFQPKDILVPEASETLAEFMGIMMGDGTVAPYHIAIALHSVDDRAYADYVSDLIFNLFGVKPKIYKRNECRAINVVVARKQLVELLQDLGLPKGNKITQGISIPDWILQNEIYSRACVRGLVDTDGSVFNHRYNSKGKRYSYKKLAFTSASENLRNDVVGIMLDNDIKPSCYGTNVRIETKSGMQRYMGIIGSHNPKHLKRLAN